MRKIAKGLVVSATVLAFAATAVSAFGATKNKWVEKSGVCYYYGSNGKTVSGRTKIGSNYYMFDSKGRQVYGWRLINGKYQFYGRGKKTGGGLVKNNTVNGIKIDSTYLRKEPPASDRSAVRRREEFRAGLRPASPLRDAGFFMFGESRKPEIPTFCL